MSEYIPRVEDGESKSAMPANSWGDESLNFDTGSSTFTSPSQFNTKMRNHSLTNEILF